MSTTLTLSGLGVAYGARTLVTGLDLVVSDGDVTALVGPNGSGKSSLMRTVVGELPVESGTIRLAPGDATIGWLPQVAPDPAESLLEYARRRTGVTAADRALHDASEALATHDPDADAAYADALEHWLHLGAADLEDRLPQVAAQVGLDVDPGRPLGSLSGGQTARAALVAVLLSRYDVLLLDEPTNNLDARGLAQMADFVIGHDGPVLVASHDRAFLDRVTTSVVELDRRSSGSATTRGTTPSSWRAGPCSDGRHSRPSRSTPTRATTSPPRPGNGPSGRRRVGARWRRAASRTSTSARSSRPARTGRARSRPG